MYLGTSDKFSDFSPQGRRKENLVLYRHAPHLPSWVGWVQKNTQKKVLNKSVTVVRLIIRFYAVLT